MICVWYNPGKEIYYAKILKHFMSRDLKVGNTNNYGHVLVCMFYIENNKNLIQCNNYMDYAINKRKYKPSYYKYFE